MIMVERRMPACTILYLTVGCGSLPAVHKRLKYWAGFSMSCIVKLTTLDLSICTRCFSWCVISANKKSSQITAYENVCLRDILKTFVIASSLPDEYQKEIRARDENIVPGVTPVMWVLLVVKLMIYFSQKLDQSTVHGKIWVLVWIQSVRSDCSPKCILLFLKIITKWETTDRLLLLFLILGGFKAQLLPIVCLSSGLGGA